MATENRWAMEETGSGGKTYSCVPFFCKLVAPEQIDCREECGYCGGTGTATLEVRAVGSGVLVQCTCAPVPDKTNLDLRLQGMYYLLFGNEVAGTHYNKMVDHVTIEMARYHGMMSVRGRRGRVGDDKPVPSYETLVSFWDGLKLPKF